MRTVITGPLVHRCPHVDELDVGRATITFVGEAPELHALRFFLDRFASEQLTHEAATQAIADAYPGAEVETEFVTAGLTVRCSACST